MLGTPFILLIAPLIFSSFVRAACYEPSPAFPVPTWSASEVRRLRPALQKIERELESTVGADVYAKTSISVMLTSSTKSLWSYFHTAAVRNETRSGAKQVDEDSQYRIASISKVFTVLALLQQHAAGNLSLDSPVINYVSGLPEKGRHGLPWKDITIRSLASQLAGIPREFAQDDIINSISDPSALGLPPASREGLPTCFEYDDFGRLCTAEDMLKEFDRQYPLFAPNQESTYSNQNYNLLGLVIENVTGLTYGAYIRNSILEELDMTLTTTETPPDKHAVLPVGRNAWDWQLSVQAPTGGIYSTAKDLSKFARYILTHFNALATGVNWLLPASFTSGVNSFYGMPFEIFRTDKILETSKRAVTFVTKSGGLLQYTSEFMLMPEYGFGITILVAGEASLTSKAREIVTVELTRAADAAIWERMAKTYDGHFKATGSLNSSVNIKASPSGGLRISSFISNGTNVLDTLRSITLPVDKPFRMQLVPTLLFKNEKEQKGEIFRMLPVLEQPSDADRQVWDDFCLTDVDSVSYAGRPLNEIVFWHEEDTVELPAWRVRLGKETRKSESKTQRPMKFEF